MSGHKDLFPESWRYNPLRWDTKRRTWVNAIAYRSDKRFKGLGEFKGCDVAGIAYFGEDRVTGIPCVRNGIPAVAATDGLAVGIFVKHCDPPLIIVDCDSGLDERALEEGKFRVIYGRNQLLALAARRGEPLPPAPAVRGNTPGHGYLIFRQNRMVPIHSRKIKPFGMHFDLIGNGHQVHWSAPGDRALLRGETLLASPPELPLWLAQLIHDRHEPIERGAKRAVGITSIANAQGLVRVWIESALATVTPDGGAWNERLFKASLHLAEAGVPLVELRRAVLERCGPTDETERRNATDSIHSAWRRVTGEVVHDE